MKTRAIACLFAAAAMSVGSLSFAQGRDGRNDGPRAQQNDNRPGNNGRPDARDQRGDNRNDRANDRGDNRNPRAWQQGDNRNDRANDRNDRRGERSGPYHYNARSDEWRRGGRVPQEYRDRTYRVDNWRAHNLRRPPPGQQWVQVGSDYVLMAVATGVIMQLLLSQ